MNDRLLKFLNLTTSDNDHEALVAIRKANELLKKDNKTWTDVLEGKANGRERPADNPFRENGPFEFWSTHNPFDRAWQEQKAREAKFRQEEAQAAAEAERLRNAWHQRAQDQATRENLRSMGIDPDKLWGKQK
jgi:hypothetical protein